MDEVNAGLRFELGILANLWKGFLVLLAAGKKGIVALFAAIAARKPFA